VEEKRSSLKKATDLRQVTDKLYHIEITLVFYDFSFILSHSNKGIKHSEDFDKKKNQT
jgi:hypothetical protein